MSQVVQLEDPTSTPTIEISVYLDTSLLRRDHCETETDAAAVMKQLRTIRVPLEEQAVESLTGLPMLGHVVLVLDGELGWMECVAR